MCVSEWPCGHLSMALGLSWGAVRKAMLCVRWLEQTVGRCSWLGGYRGMKVCWGKTGQASVLRELRGSAGDVRRAVVKKRW